MLREETHSLVVSACTWMFSAQGHTHSNHPMLVHKQKGLSAILKTAFQWSYRKQSPGNVFLFLKAVM